ncbi:hypothetical protein Btru_004957 [Bulinus truncatus]|nr:hypothetical protein Btru_004957 [Bulinus truncatus]
MGMMYVKFYKTKGGQILLSHISLNLKGTYGTYGTHDKGPDVDVPDFQLGKVAGLQLFDDDSKVTRLELKKFRVIHQAVFLYRIPDDDNL